MEKKTFSEGEEALKSKPAPTVLSVGSPGCLFLNVSGL